MDAARIQSLFPPGVEVHCLDDSGPEPPLSPEEERFVATAVSKRRREFAFGRACARAALARLGVAAGPLLVGPDRSPVWPAGFIGSISHCPGLAAAAVARRSDCIGVGIDLEPAEPVSERLFRQIATERERTWLSSLPDAGLAARLLFAAKESVYKAIHPQLGVFVGFQECEIEMDPGGGAFRAQLHSDRLPAEWNGRTLTGRHDRDDRHLVAAVALPAGDRVLRRP